MQCPGIIGTLDLNVSTWAGPPPGPWMTRGRELLSYFSAEGLWVKHFEFPDLNFLTNKKRDEVCMIPQSPSSFEVLAH